MANSIGRGQTLEAGLRPKRSNADWKKNYPERQDQLLDLSSRTSTTPLEHASSVFISDKQLQSLSDDVVKKYIRLLSRLKTYCEGCNVLTVQGITRDLITGFCKDWPELYPSSIARAKFRERLRLFLRYCYEAQWLERIPPVPKFKIEEPET